MRAVIVVTLTVGVEWAACASLPLIVVVIALEHEATTVGATSFGSGGALLLGFLKMRAVSVPVVTRAFLEEFAVAAISIAWGAIWALLAPGSIGMCAAGAVAAALATAATPAFSTAAAAAAAAASTAATAIVRTVRIAAGGDIGLTSLVRFIRLDLAEDLDDAFAGGG